MTITERSHNATVPLVMSATDWSFVSSSSTGVPVISAAVLVGGHSRRMGRDKAALEWQGRSFLHHISGTLTQVFDDVMLVGGMKPSELPFPVRSVPDIHPDCGPLSGIHSALMHAKSDAVFITACDMPRVTAPLIRSFLALWSGTPVFAAREGDRIHPLFALYTKHALPTIEAALCRGTYRIQPLLQDLEAAFADLTRFSSDGNTDVLRNVNTPEEFEALLREGVPHGARDTKPES